MVCDCEIMSWPFYLKISLLFVLMAPGQCLMDAFVYITEEVPALWTFASESLKIWWGFFILDENFPVNAMLNICWYSVQDFIVFVIIRLTSMFSVTYLNEIKNKILVVQHDLCFWGGLRRYLTSFSDLSGAGLYYRKEACCTSHTEEHAEELK